MNSKSLATLLKLVFPITFNVIFLLILIFTSVHAAAWWSWFFVNLSYAAMILLPYYMVYLITAGGFVIIFLIGFLIMAINPESWGVSTFVVMFVLTMLEAACVLVYMLINSRSAGMAHQQLDDSNSLRSIVIDLKSVEYLFKDAAERKNLQQLIDLINSSPMASRDDVRNLEDEVRSTVADIISQIKAGEQSDYNAMFEAAQQAMLNRNNKLKSLG